MFELLPSSFPVILENADVLKATVPLQILNAMGNQAQELLNLRVARIPEIAVVARILKQNFVSANRAHAVIETISAATGFTLDVIERMGMHH
jgi:hypothetical protein